MNRHALDVSELYGNAGVMDFKTTCRDCDLIVENTEYPTHAGALFCKCGGVLDIVPVENELKEEK